jgi:hypothetical protein
MWFDFQKGFVASTALSRAFLSEPLMIPIGPEMTPRSGFDLPSWPVMTSRLACHGFCPLKCHGFSSDHVTTVGPKHQRPQAPVRARYEAPVKSEMKAPEDLYLSTEQGDALIERLEHDRCTPEDRQILVQVLRLYFWLLFALQESKLSLKRLRLLLFGKPFHGVLYGHGHAPDLGAGMKLAFLRRG